MNSKTKEVFETLRAFFEMIQSIYLLKKASKDSLSNVLAKGFLIAPKKERKFGTLFQDFYFIFDIPSFKYSL